MSSEAPDGPRILTIAANNGEIGGGEVMLLAMARAARSGGWDVKVVGPGADGGVMDVAERDGFAVDRLPRDRPAYMRALRRRDGGRRGLLWCNGLVPAAATLGHPHRVVHLHRRPEGLHRGLARVARLGARLTVAPSTYLAVDSGLDVVLPNWTPPVSRAPSQSSTLRVGFMGRWAREKGLDVLARALLDPNSPSSILVLAGEPRFSNATETEVIESALAALGDRVVRVGWVPPEALFGTVDVLVVPSREAESFGLVAAEAMSARLPCIVTDAGALPEVVGDDYPWIARGGSVEDLARIISAVAGTDSDTRDQIAERAHQRWEENFSPLAGTQRFLTLLDAIAGRGAS